MYVPVCTVVCIHACMHCVLVRAYVCVRVCVCVRVRMCVHARIGVCVFVYACGYVCVRAHVKGMKAPFSLVLLPQEDQKLIN